MVENSIAATVYSYWDYFFRGSLFQAYTNKGKTESQAMSMEPDDKDPEKKVQKQFW